MVKLEPKKLLLTGTVALLLLQAFSLVVSTIFHIPTLKLGQAILLIILASGLAILINASFKFGELDNKDLFALAILVGMIVGAYKYIPIYFPDIFSVLKPEIFSVVN